MRWLLIPCAKCGCKVQENWLVQGLCAYCYKQKLYEEEGE